MTEVSDVSASSPHPLTCARCSQTLEPADAVQAGSKVFCRSCYEILREQLVNTAREMSSNVNYVNASIGALLGGAVGAALWCGFTVVTHISFGLVAVAIGFLVGQGTVRFAGMKRSQGLQVLAVTVALASFVVATYLVNMTFANQALAAQGDPRRVTFPPATLVMFTSVLKLGFGLMDVVFLAITLFQAWKIPMPLKIPASGES